MAAFNLINSYDHKNSKSEGVSSLKEMSTQWNRTGVVFSSPYGLRRVGFMVYNVESARSGPPWTSFPVLFYSMLCTLVIFVTNM
jgi:hypothetical protein